MTSWWNSLDTAYRQMLVGGGIFVAVVLIVAWFSVSNFRAKKRVAPAEKPCRHDGFRIQGVMAATGLTGWMCVCGSEVESPYQALGAELGVLAIDPEPGRPYTFYPPGEFAPGERRHLRGS